MNRRHKKVKNKFVHNLEYIFDMYTTLDNIYSYDEVNSVMILKGSNGGGIPKPGNDFYVRIINEIHKDEMYINPERFTGIKVDTFHIEMLINLANSQTGKLSYEVKDMPDCLLKRMWQSEGAKYKDVYFLHATDTEYFYCTIGSDKMQQYTDNFELQAQLELGTNSLRQIFKKFNT